MACKRPINQLREQSHYPHQHKTDQIISTLTVECLLNNNQPLARCDYCIKPVSVNHGLAGRLRAELQTTIKQTQREADAVQREIDNIMVAIKACVVTPTTKRELEAAESRKAEADMRLQTALALDKRAIARMVEAMPEVLDRYRKTLDNIGTALEAKLEHSRTLLQSLLGEITLHKEKHGLEAVFNLD
jgi:hypothetical protein